MHKFNKISFTKFYAMQEYNMTINIQYIISVSHKDRRYCIISQTHSSYILIVVIKEVELVDAFSNSTADSVDDIVTEFVVVANRHME